MSTAPRSALDVDLFLLPSEAGDAALRDRVVVVVDVLRACSTIAAAFGAGAEKVIPAESVVAATKIFSALDRDHALLCGEREGKKVSGFDLGNSPLEYVPEAVGGKTLVFATTNGSKVLARTAGARETLVCALTNVGATAARLLALEEPVAIVLSGQGGRFALEDAVCGGKLVALLRRARSDLVLNDAARAAETLAGPHDGDLLGMLRSTSHGRYLESIGFGADLEACARVDSVRILPVCREGRITADAPVHS